MSNIGFSAFSTGKLPEKILLVGNPNSGKTTLFNRLTGLNYKTANYPGVTVETKTGVLKAFDPESGEMKAIVCIDLPGVYSLFPESEDEKVACREILNQTLQKDTNAVVLFVADSLNLERSLFLFEQIKSLGIRLVLLLNMADLAEKSGIKIDIQLLQERLGGTPCFAVNSRGNKSVNELKSLLRQYRIPTSERNPDFVELLHLNNPETVIKTQDAIRRHEDITRILKNVIQHNSTQNTIFRLTQNADKIFTHPLGGIFVFLALMFVIFQALFSWSSVPMDAIEIAFASVISFLRDFMPEGLFADLICSGILPGLSGIFVFIPQIAFLFLFISLMEESGYMARATYLFDKIMRRFGLNGRSIIPMIGGAACAVPSILATRTISNRKERLITIFVTPLISCSARLPVYTVMIALVIPNQNWGPVNLQGLILFGLYLIGIFAALATALFLKYIIKSGEKSFLMMEMPMYKKPDFRNVLGFVWGKIKIFITEAGSIILLISIILWVLSSYSFPGRFDKIHESVIQHTELNPEQQAAMLESAKLEASFAGMIGKKIEPAIAPLGFDWKIGIALITSFAAREVFVGTMGTLYSVGSSGDIVGLTEKLRSEKNRQTGKPRFDFATGLSLIIFYVFALQCMSTLAVVKRETGNWKIPALQFFYMGALAYLASFVTYQALI